MPGWGHDIQLPERLKTFKSHMHPTCADTDQTVLDNRNGTYHSVE